MNSWSLKIIFFAQSVLIIFLQKTRSSLGVTLEHHHIIMFHLKVLLLRSSSFSACLQVKKSFLFYFAPSASALFVLLLKSISTFSSASFEPSYFLPHVVAVSYNWSLWCTRDRGMVRSTLVKFFTVTRGTIQNSVSFSISSCTFNSPINGNTKNFRIVGTILGPTPLLAANFVIFGVLIHRLGVQYSRLSPRSCKTQRDY